MSAVNRNKEVLADQYDFVVNRNERANCAYPISIRHVAGSSMEGHVVKLKEFVTYDIVSVKQEPCDSDMQCAGELRVKTEEMDFENNGVRDSLDLSSRLDVYNGEEQDKCSPICADVSEMQTTEATNENSITVKEELSDEDSEHSNDFIDHGSDEPDLNGEDDDSESIDSLDSVLHAVKEKSTGYCACTKPHKYGTRKNKNIKKETTTIIDQPNGQTNTDDPQTCKVCEKPIPKRAVEENGRKSYQCTICDKKFTQRITLSRHLLIHSGEKPYPCTVCEKKFAHKFYLNTHMLTHTGEKPHECSVCKKKFSQKITLNQHMLRHTGTKSHVCIICERKFTQKLYLNMHMLTHTGEKPHTCTVCDRNFAQKVTLKQHMLIHTGEKPHVCNVCGNSFTQKSSLRYHMVTHSGEKAHACQICGKKLSQKGSLQRHILTHITGNTPKM